MAHAHCGSQTPVLRRKKHCARSLSGKTNGRHSTGYCRPRFNYSAIPALSFPSGHFRRRQQLCSGLVRCSRRRAFGRRIRRARGFALIAVRYMRRRLFRYYRSRRCVKHRRHHGRQDFVPAASRGKRSQAKKQEQNKDLFHLIIPFLFYTLLSIPQKTEIIDGIFLL